MAKSPAPILKAKSVAIVGATERSHWPTNIFANTTKSGYPGNIYPVNPKRETVWGVKCYPSLSNLPEAPELGLLIVPAKAIPAVLQEGMKAGMKGAIVYASGIGEGEDPEVIAKGEALKELIETGDISVCGPNCMGLASMRENLYLYPHTHVRNLKPGPVGLVFQSGGTLSYFVRSASERGVGFSYTISSGNELDLDLSDYMNFLIDDEHTKIITLFIEGIRKPADFMVAAGRALAAGKPIIAIKTGRSQGSRAAAQSHSGAISGDFEVYEAVCERYGINDCKSLDDMLETTLAFMSGRLPKGPNVAYMTTSGGTVDLLHDYVEAENASMPDLAPQSVEAIAKWVSSDVHIRNPIDTGSPIGAADGDQPIEICKIMAQDPNIDMVAWAANMPGSERRRRPPEVVRDLLASTDKPVVAFARMIHGVTREGLDYQDETGLYFMQGLQPSVQALKALWFYAQRKGRAVPALTAPKGKAADVADAAAVEAALEKKGIAPPRSMLALDVKSAAAAAHIIGLPVAIKIISPQISHKTETGGVRLNLRTEKEVEAETQSLISDASKASPDAEITGVLVQQMVSGLEILIGAREDPLYGPMMVVGAGGVMVELIKDAAFRLLPLAENDPAAMLSELKAARLLEGFRGAPAADTDALIVAIRALGDFYLDHRDNLSEIEINPLMVLAKGHGVSAVDIRTVRRKG